MTMEPKYFESLYPEDTRDQELEKIVSFIREGGSCQVVGLPGVGRSNILGLLAYNRAVRLRHFPKHHGIVHFVMVNFSEVKRRPLADVLKFLFLCLGNSLRERQMQEEYEKVDGMFKAALSHNDELVLSQGLKQAVEYLAIEKKLTIIFLLDRFDDYIPQVNEDFFIFLRSLRDKAKYRFSVIFALSRPLEGILEPQLLSDFSDFVVGHIIYLPLYDQPGVNFRISYLEKLTAKTLMPSQKNEIIALTGGHMRLVKVAVEAMLASSDLRLVSSNELAIFLLEQKTVQSAITSIWKSLTPAEQAILASRGQRLEVSSERNERGYLVQAGLVKDGRIVIPLFEQAIKNGLFKENEAKLVFDEITNAIKKGEVVISDSLTKAEFRLLRYLLQHPDEVVDRETIVSTVWKEAASTAGVTEQAIDQLLFRLRRKIEEDPNNPRYLLTIKGRGIKFSQ